MCSWVYLNLDVFHGVILMSVDLAAVKSHTKGGRQGQLCLFYLHNKCTEHIEELNNNSELHLNRQKQILKVLSSTCGNL